MGEDEILVVVVVSVQVDVVSGLERWTWLAFRVTDAETVLGLLARAVLEFEDLGVAVIV